MGEEDVEVIKNEEAHIIEEQEDLKEEQEEILEELKATSTEKSLALEEESENEEEKDSSLTTLPMAGIAIVACAVVASLVVIKKKFLTSKPKKTDFAPVSD